MKNTVNPYLPSYEYIPDGEPHVFNDRLYIFGSHDEFNGKAYCEKDYVVYSAPVNNLSDFRCDGVSFRKDQGHNESKAYQLWAPDVCKGTDGKYYLYYCKAFSNYIGVAKADNPAGPYEYYGTVKYPDGIDYGKKDEDFPFDPGIFVDDDGRVYLYTGFAPNNETFEKMLKLYFKINSTGESSFVIELEKDMKTLKSVRPLLPTAKTSAGTGFEGHAFFEASSMRKFNGKYYFIYSTEKSHELAYAMSDYPDRDFVYKGVLHSNGNIGIDKKAVYPWGNNHGSIECINGQYYIFGHRQTNYHEYSRQGVVEKISMDENGEFKQAEMTSQGINGRPLTADCEYNAGIACVLKSKKGVFKVTMIKDKTHYPMITQDKKDGDTSAIQYIEHITDGAVIGYKYFDYKDNKNLAIQYCGKASGTLYVCQEEGKPIGKFDIVPSKEKTVITTECKFENGTYPLYFKYEGKGSMELYSFKF